ncbi:MAG: hypothetical protein ACTSQE_07010 [Candidatus Heimdallarchaeaceae archaeon]
MPKIKEKKMREWYFEMTERLRKRAYGGKIEVPNHYHIVLIRSVSKSLNKI